MALVLVIGGTLGWYVRDVQLQRAAVAVVERAHGRVGYDWEYSDDEPDAHGASWAPDWLRRRVGVDYFGSVVAVGIREKGTDTDLAWIGKLPGIRQLSIRHAPVTEAGLAHLEGIAGLRALYLCDEPITDAGLAHFSLAKLRWLYLDGTLITDLSLPRLEGSTELEWLSLNGTRITDRGLVHLKGLPSLTGLSLQDCSVSDAGIASLRGCNRLEKLWLGGSKVSPQGARQLMGALPKLNVSMTSPGG
jgi:hypothetical protein